MLPSFLLVVQLHIITIHFYFVIYCPFQTHSRLRSVDTSLASAASDRDSLQAKCRLQEKTLEDLRSQLSDENTGRRLTEQSVGQLRLKMEDVKNDKVWVFYDIEACFIINSRYVLLWNQGMFYYGIKVCSIMESRYVLLWNQGMFYYGIKVCFIMESRFVLLWNQGMF